MSKVADEWLTRLFEIDSLEDDSKLPEVPKSLGEFENARFDWKFLVWDVIFIWRPLYINLFAKNREVHEEFTHTFPSDDPFVAKKVRQFINRFMYFSTQDSPLMRKMKPLLEPSE